MMPTLTQENATQSKYHRILLLLILSVCAVSPPALHAEEQKTLQQKLAALPQPWQNKLHRLTLKEYTETLKYWEETYPDWVQVDRIGVTLEGIPIPMLKITDQKVDDQQKQICLMTALHGGPERSGTTAVLHFIEWLTSNDPAAKETRENQLLLIIPIINPYAYFETDRFGNSQKIDPYTGGGTNNWDLKTLQFKHPEKSPEVMAVLSVMDQFQPDVHVDVHGTGLQEYAPDQLGSRERYRGQTMFEVTGSAYSNVSLRPWDWRITEAINEAGTDAGYGYDRFEADAQRLYWGQALTALSKKLWLGRPNFYTAHYGYARYHTMVMALEVGWEQSGVARLKALMNIGNKKWKGEYFPGYPVNRLQGYIGHFVSAWGTTAKARRQSRVELWQKQPYFSQALLYPQTAGRETYFIATSAKSAALLSADTSEFLENIQPIPSVDQSALKAIFEAGPEMKIALSKGSSSTKEETPLENGISFQLRIPYRNPDLVDIRLNGHLLEKSATDGFLAWYGDGFTHVQVNIPPEISKVNDLYIITCLYNPQEQRSYGWKPPQVVRERIKQNTD
ncbi:M14 family zinc carboxypeptidase [Gimesia fumaroli]|uniref:Zinc carboxypeptidase n=1 Tax=Gimesia fumaroli TaxID=2527976 RepID=A0A518I8K8_9PLAN|nr:M14 family zinc carboxypeptidase [Gimesia fumaroli]QDV49420.1 Zinc carboxypeptidase [Gimesia fumaroli]